MIVNDYTLSDGYATKCPKCGRLTFAWDWMPCLDTEYECEIKYGGCGHKWAGRDLIETVDLGSNDEHGAIPFYQDAWVDNWLEDGKLVQIIDGKEVRTDYRLACIGDYDPRTHGEWDVNDCQHGNKVERCKDCSRFQGCPYWVEVARRKALGDNTAVGLQGVTQGNEINVAFIKGISDNIKLLLTRLEQGGVADKMQLTYCISTMIDFLDKVIKTND